MAVQPATFQDINGGKVGTDLTAEQSLLMDAFDKTANTHNQAVTKLVDITKRNMRDLHEQVRRGHGRGLRWGMSAHMVWCMCDNVATSGVPSGASGPD